ncbi:MAG: hypothetical protein KF884_02895 [Fimbriimonadaceae bacterium]|nr:hypothetical protein [Fimbriimonadaceae bacterium]QYK59044.1 MAG: hypothetical protein KF884_02895 [Fimbriimonadaceae bacterium]
MAVWTLAAGQGFSSDPLALQAFRGAARSVGRPVTSDAMDRALEQRARLTSPFESPLLDPGSWTSMGPNNFPGRIRTVLVDRTNASRIWAASPGGGIWRSLDGGVTWAPVGDSLPAMAVSCLAQSSGDPNLLFAGTGEGFFQSTTGAQNTSGIRGAGIYMSSNGGDTWSGLPSTSGLPFQFVNEIAVSPTNPNLILAATWYGVWRSANGGGSWAKVYPVSGFQPAYDVKFSNNGSEALANVSGATRVVRSTDAGQSFTAVAGIPGSADRVELQYSQNSNIVYAAVSVSNSIRIYRSNNAGALFNLQSSGNGVPNKGRYNLALWVNRVNNANEIAVGGDVFAYSNDGGVTLTTRYSDLPENIFSIVNAPTFNGGSNRDLFVGTEAGVFRADLAATTSAPLNNGLVTTMAMGGVAHRAGNRISCGALSHGILNFDSTSWQVRATGDGGYGANTSTPGRYFNSTQLLNVYRTDNNGSTFSHVSTGIGERDTSNTNYLAPLAIDHSNQNRLLAGGRSLWRTNNANATVPTWSVIKASLAPPGNFTLPESALNISAIAIAPSNPDVVYIAYNGGRIEKSTNATSVNPTWTVLDDSGGTLPDRFVSKIIVHPTNPSIATLSFMGYEAGNIWRTTNGGSTFTNISGSGSKALPAVPVSALAIDPSDSNRIFVGTDIGLFSSHDGGASWSTLTQGPGAVPIETLEWFDPDTLVAYTYGRGVWTAKTTGGKADDAPRNVNPTVGVHIGGDLESLAVSDDDRYSVAAVSMGGPGEVPAATGVIAVEFTGQAPNSVCQMIEVTFEASVQSLGLTQRIEAWNYTTQSWTLLDSRAATLADSVVLAVVSGPTASQYINGENFETRLRVVYVTNNSGPQLKAVAKIDRVQWSVTY